MAMTDMSASSPLQPQHHHPAQQQQQQQSKAPASSGKVAKKAPPALSSSAASHVKGNRINGVEMRVPDRMEVDMARQDVLRVCNPDIKRPFSSIEDACDRLLPYHVVAEYDPEELEVSPSESRSGATTLLISRAQSWNDTLKAKTAEYVGALDKHINTFNSIMKRRSDGEMRGEERLLVEKYLLVDERQKLADARAKIEAKERAEREAQEARVKEALAQAEKARAEALARAEAQAQAEAARAKALAQAEAAQQAESSQQLSQVFPSDISIDDTLQPPINGEGLENLEGWGSSEGEEEYEETQPAKEDEEDEDEDNPDSLFADDDETENAFEGVQEDGTTTQNELADEDVLHFNPRESMSRD